MTERHPPAADVRIDADLVRALLSAQHPDLADLPLSDPIEGWDNTMFRLGQTQAVRLPRRAISARLGETEWEWLPRISHNLTFPVPAPQRLGEPGEGYPWRWSVVPWITGTTAFEAPLTEAGARDLGLAIAQIQLTSAADAPVNPYRSGTLSDVADIFDARVEAAVAAGDLSPEQGDGVRAVFKAAGATPEPRRTWGHLDLHGGNVLTSGGRLTGILDWGDAGAADPATDLGQACVLVGADRVDALLDAYGTAEGPLRVGKGSGERLRVVARAAAYAMTLATIEEPYRSVGLNAVADILGGGTVARLNMGTIE